MNAGDERSPDDAPGADTGRGTDAGPGQYSEDADAAQAQARLKDAATTLRVAERRQEGGASPLGPRAERTRRRLIDSASRLFAERGYLSTSVSEIAEDAGVSLATFYQYFSERNDIVKVLLGEVIDEMLSHGVDRWDVRTGRIGLRRVIAPYVEGYRRHRQFFELWQCVAHVDDRMRGLYRDYHGWYQHRFSRYLTDGVELGLVRGDLDPAGMARAMTLMMERYCYEVYVLNPEPELPAHADVTDLITVLWADAIRLREHGEQSALEVN